MNAKPRFTLDRMISFIIPAHNEAQQLGATLTHLKAAGEASEEAFEIIVVDDASTDATVAIARSHGVRVVSVQHRHISATRNEGANHALGEVLMFVDADTHVSGKLVKQALRALAEGVQGGGAVVRLHGNPRWLERVIVRIMSWGLRWKKLSPGCFMFCTQQTFRAAGRFDETLFAAEDLALSQALKNNGSFVILSTPSYTSDRKMRTHTLADHWRVVQQYRAQGLDVLRSREHLGLWYGERRNQ